MPYKNRGCGSEKPEIWCEKPEIWCEKPEIWCEKPVFLRYGFFLKNQYF
jgi:hypothetical protein